MAAITPLTGIVFTAGEIAAAKAAFEDPVGMMSALLQELNEISGQLTRLSTIIGAGANQTTINTAITTIS